MMRRRSIIVILLLVAFVAVGDIVIVSAIRHAQPGDARTQTPASARIPEVQESKGDVTPSAKEKPADSEAAEEKAHGGQVSSTEADAYPAQSSAGADREGQGSYVGYQDSEDDPETDGRADVRTERDSASTGESGDAATSDSRPSVAQPPGSQSAPVSSDTEYDSDGEIALPPADEGSGSEGAGDDEVVMSNDGDIMLTPVS